MPWGCDARLTASMPLLTLLYCNVVWVGWGWIGVSPVRRGHNRHRPGRKVVVKQEKGAEDPTAFGAGGSHHPWADPGSRLSLEPYAVTAITPGPCRGWGRHCLAHIRAHREPGVSPAGTGRTEESRVGKEWVRKW